MITAQAYRSEEFQKEHVLRRLRKTAVRLWDLQENEIDDLDPIVDLMLEACAVEFERTSQDVYSSQARVLQRLANLMVPEVFTNARPAHSVIFAKAESASAMLKVHDQFVIEKEVQTGNTLAKVTVVFSPVQETKVFDASVVCQVGGKSISLFENAYQRKEKVVLDNQVGPTAYSLWLGVKLNKKVEDLNTMTLFFDWRNEVDNKKYLQHLPGLRVFVENRQLKVLSGIQREKDDTLAEFDPMRELEAHVLQIYRRQFSTIEESVVPVLALYPAAFASGFSEEQLKLMKDELCWIRVEFPEAVPPQAIGDVFCAVNCVPVMNRKLHATNRPYTLSRNLNIIPLQHTEQFLCVKRVHSPRQEYTSVTMQGMRSTQDGAYSVRQGGVERFDQRSASAQLTYLYELLRDESAAFAAFGIQALSNELKALDQGLSRFESYFTQKGLQQASRCHLLVNTRQPEDVWVEFWTTLGEVANKITPGKKATLLSAANVKRDSITLMTVTSGGKAQMTDGEKLHAYKHTLLTRSRIVTEEDLRSACFAQLGSCLKDVIIRRGVKKDIDPKKGYGKTIEVDLVPATGSELNSWEDSCAEMQAFIDRRKSFTTSVQVICGTTKTRNDARP